MEKRNMWISYCFTLLLLTVGVCCIAGCESVPGSALMDSVEIEATRTFTNKTLYAPGESIVLQPFYIKNRSEKKITIDTILIKIDPVDTNDPGASRQKIIDTPYSIEGNGQREIPRMEIVNADDGPGSKGYLVHAELILSIPEDGQIFKQKESVYLTFFRIADNDQNLTYTINSTDYHSLPVFTLHGGLSAEYTAQKAVAALAGGISHSWNIPAPGMGPAPLKSTPDFLERSLRQTVDFYDATFGKNEIFETVIISTGIPSGAYLARALNAPVLPIHFLAGVHTTKEIQTMLDYSEAQGTAAYATIGHDYSLSDHKAVAWIKLLSLPDSYRQFLIDHQVRNVIFHGALGLGGESAAKKLKDNNEHYGTGSIYLMHFAGNNSETYLSQTIRDFDTQNLGPLVQIADWEAGVIEQQVDYLSEEIKEKTSVGRIEFVTTRDAIHLWNMGTYMMLHLLKKNDLALKGISFNPYLIAHPVFETYRGYVPFLYWQGTLPPHHIDNRLTTLIQGAVAHYFPNTTFNELTCWVNSTNNFGGRDQGANMAKALQQNGFHRIVNNIYSLGEEWNPADGMESAVEVRADSLVQLGVDQLQQWNQNLQYLTIADLKEIADHWTDVLVISK